MLTTRFGICLCVCAALALSACGGGGASVTPDPGGGTPPPDSGAWSASACTTVTGSAFTALTTDAGAVLIDDGSAGPPSTSVFAFGLAKTGRNALAAVVDGILYRSNDVGCTWTQADSLGGEVVYLTAADADTLYAYSPYSAGIHRIHTTTGLTVVQAPEVGVHALWADAAAPLHIRLSAGPNRRQYDSTDGGATFTAAGVPARSDLLSYFTAIDPADPDHVLQGTAGAEIGAQGAGIWLTRNGGTTWVRATGFTGRINGFTGRFSETDGNRAWVLGLDLDDDSLARRKLYRSTDGGASFEPVVTASMSLPLNNATEPWPDPLQPDRVFFSITDPANVLDRHTTLYAYDHATGVLTANVHDYAAVGELRVMVFNPDHQDHLLFTKTFQLTTAQ